MSKSIQLTQDKIAAAVIEEMNNRSIEGNKIYKGTMYDEIELNKKDLLDFVNDVREELMDAVLYLKSVEVIIKKEQENV